MLLTDLYKIPIGISLGVVAVVLLGSILISILRPPKPVPGGASIPKIPLVESSPKED